MNHPLTLAFARSVFRHTVCSSFVSPVAAAPRINPLPLKIRIQLSCGTTPLRLAPGHVQKEEQGLSCLLRRLRICNPPISY